MSDEELRELGRQVGREIQARIAANTASKKPKRGNRRTGPATHSKRDKFNPTGPYEFIRGGMTKIEYIAAARAADEAVRIEREHWLPILESWLEVYAEDRPVAAIIRAEVKRLRRCLGIKPSTASVREQTRQRVRRYRNRTRSEPR